MLWKPKMGWDGGEAKMESGHTFLRYFFGPVPKTLVRRRFSERDRKLCSRCHSVKLVSQEVVRLDNGHIIKHDLGKLF